MRTKVCRVFIVTWHTSKVYSKQHNFPQYIFVKSIFLIQTEIQEHSIHILNISNFMKGVIMIATTLELEFLITRKGKDGFQNSVDGALNVQIKACQSSYLAPILVS